MTVPARNIHGIHGALTVRIPGNCVSLLDGLRFSLKLLEMLVLCC